MTVNIPERTIKSFDSLRGKDSVEGSETREIDIQKIITIVKDIV